MKRQIFRSALPCRVAVVALLAAMLFPVAAFAALDAADVPAFHFRARVISVKGAPPEDKQTVFTFGPSEVAANGAAWSEWMAFGPEAVAWYLKGYPNLYIKRYPFVVKAQVHPLQAPTVIEGEVKLDETGAVYPFRVELLGPALALLVWRDADRQPHVGTSADYNGRYWRMMEGVEVAPAQRPKYFPIVDGFFGEGNDVREWEEGYNHLARLGINAMFQVPADPRFREMLRHSGIARMAQGIYNPPGYAFEFTAQPGSSVPAGWTGKPGSTTPEAMAQWAQERIDPYLKAGFKADDLAVFAMSDEPGWYFPMWTTMLQESPLGLQHFRDYLKARGLTPRDVGAASWEQVLPLGRGKAVDLPSRRLFYWTVRFLAWDSARHFANATRALEKATYPNLPIFTNWGYIDRLYFPGCYGNNPDKTSPDAASGGHDWLEFGRMRGCTMLWTEDWFSDADAYQWSYFSAKLRCAAEKGGVHFGGYIVPRAGGDRAEGIEQKILTVIGSGGKALEYFVFGPEYTFPVNCYSETGDRVLPQMADAHRMIGQAEDLLWPGTRPRTPVAILDPRSAQIWDRQDVPDTNRELNSLTVDYMAEEFNLYVALQHADIPADFVEEDDLSAKGLRPYKVLYVTEPNIPAEFQQGLLAWVRNGGTVVTVTNAGTADRFDDPCDILAKGLGIAEQPRTRAFISSPKALQAAGTGTGAAGTFTAFGPRGTLRDAPKKGVLATFADGAPAIIERKVGRGRVVHFTWMPGLSYLKSSTTTKDRLPAGFSTVIRGMIAYPVQAARVTPPVTVDQPMIETPLLLSAKGAAVTLLNWSGEAPKPVTLVIRAPFTVQSVASVKQGKLPFTRTKDGITCILPLGAADIVLLRP